MAIKINTAYGERLTSGMLNEKISNLVGGNEKLSGFDVSIASPTSVTIKPGKAIINGCAIEETSDTNTVVIDPRILSNDSIAYVVIDYSHENKRVVFSCVAQLTSSMVKLATLFIKSGVISELTNHNPLQTLNSIVSEAAEIEAQRVRDSIPSGFVELGGLDYDFMLNNENQVKLKTKSIAYVNGYRVEIPAGTIIDIGKSPEKSTREDLLFLEAWKDTDFSKNGKLKYRIRHVSNVDFNRYHMDGFSAGTNGRNIQVTAQGGSDKPFTPTFDTDATGSFNRSDLLHLNDTGLFVTSQNAKLFKTFDGYVYAIPMFRLYRKPSCGKSIPFEYSKINPKVNYNKFTKLMKEDKVERVVTENIQGRSLVNLINSVIGDNPLNDSGSYWGKSFTYVVNLKPNTLYTLIIDFELLDTSYAKLDSIILGDSASISNAQSNYRLWKIPTGNNVIQFTTPSDYEPRNVRFVIEKSNSPNKPTLRLNNCMIVEGDLSNKEIPEFFTGLKSLGEDDGNLITIKNGILNDDTYDINDGNQKLLAFSEVTHINSTNTIIPTIEANVIKGEESTPLEKLGSKLETEGHEVIEFTKIKGKTIQNLSTLREGTLNFSPTPANSVFIDPTYTLKANTDYTIILNIKSNTLDSSFKLSLHAIDHSVFWEGINEHGKTGEFRFKFNKSTEIISVRFYTDNTNAGSVELTDIMLLEGNHLTTPLEELPFVEGIKSVGETEDNKVVVKSCGKNLFDGKLQRGYWFNGSLNPSDYSVASINYIPVKINTNYTITIENYSGKIYVAELSSSFNELGTHTISSGSSITVNKGNFIKFCTDNSSTAKLELNAHIQIEEGTVVTPYEPYKEYRQEIHLKEPLRSLPNGVCDELVGNKVIRRVGKVILDGSTGMWADTALNQSNTIAFVIKNPGLRNKDNGSLLSSLLPPVDGDTYWSKDIECIMSANEVYFKFRVLKTKLDSLDNGGMQKWLKSNPITVYYELLNPIDEYLENVYEKESIKTYQLDAPLRSLPNGIKDEIKNGVLIRRCGEYIINGSETFQNSGANANVNTECFTLMNSPSDLRGGTMCMSDKFIYDNSIWNIDKECIATISPSNRFLIRVTRSNLTSATPTGLKDWLQSNPIKVIYELATPIETRLKEVKPQTADFSYNRQLAEGNYLRELPNGVKDTIENGKVIRRTKKLVLNGSENWITSRFAEQSEFIGFELAGIGLKPGNRTNLVCDKFNVIETINQNNTCEGIQASSTNDLLWIKIYKTRLTEQTIQGFKQWLQSNPVTVLYELATPTEEALSTDNYMSYPSHEFNTYCGSMYVGEGRNYVISDTKMPSENTIIIETDFREIEGKAKVEDCKYKKNDDGYDTMYETGLGNNKLKLTPSNMEQGTSYNVDNITWEEAKNKASFVTTRVRMKDTFRVSPNTQYTINNTGNLQFVVKEFNANGIGIKDVGWFDTPYKFTTTANTKFMVLMFMKRDGSAITPTEVLNANFMLNLGDSALPYEPFVPCEVAFENTEENDIEDLRHQVSLTGFNYNQVLNESFDKLLRGEL